MPGLKISFNGVFQLLQDKGLFLVSQHFCCRRLLLCFQPRCCYQEDLQVGHQQFILCQLGGVAFLSSPAPPTTVKWLLMPGLPVQKVDYKYYYTKHHYR